MYSRFDNLMFGQGLNLMRCPALLDPLDATAEREREIVTDDEPLSYTDMFQTKQREVAADFRLPCRIRV